MTTTAETRIFKSVNVDMIITLATKITIGRILAVPVFILMLLYYFHSIQQQHPDHFLRLGATFFFFAITISDALDGYIARTRNQITRLGKILDPLADKTLLLSAIIMLGQAPAFAFALRIPFWFILLVISRDFFLLLGATIIHITTGTVEVRPRLIGKCTTVFQMVLIVWVLLEFPGQWFHGFLILTSCCILISLGWYIYDGLKQLEKA